MAVNILKEKERQQILLYTFIFLIVFLFLIWQFPPSFNFSLPPGLREDKGREEHLEIIKTLDEIDFSRMVEFRLIPDFEGVSGRANPFFLGGEVEAEDEDSENGTSGAEENGDGGNE